MLVEYRSTWDDSKGKMIKSKDADSLTKSMNFMILNSVNYDSKLIRNYAVENFGNDSISRQFNDLYNRAIDN